MSYQKKAKGLLQEFKAFALKGNVIDLAVAVVVGAAFNKIVSSLVENIIMPALSILLGGIDFRDWSVRVDGATISYGIFLQSVIDFILIAFSIFVAIKVLRRLQRTEDEKPESQKEIEPTEEVKLLREIRDSLKK
ncbi:hypothetical protein A2837_02680 [Candidatus Kaiserbacteria bacterium RIFCSPHIGHO2_01_FULL_46_22]|uniref:Large-conductance mechanosensitive channel n=1 Tax=Candidatus Kaiserbacteria bacterium RIFCSPHIGHO2_01_FULL_46_22 TaxID=1798475 RepID=A0A1F6BWR7_9BACT|nr:MAG: hypothetical protein A2837_02680 [Candidatus Kaiserbacteria bacterium RIFCSPHIGHO2_01_FULL_46_22]